MLVREHDLSAGEVRDTAHLREAKVGERDVDADQRDGGRLAPAGVLLLPVLVDLFTVFQNLGDGLDNGDKVMKVLAELGGVKDLEEVEGLCLLRESRPAANIPVSRGEGEGGRLLTRCLPEYCSGQG
jgi:hypothetical protein